MYSDKRDLRCTRQNCWIHCDSPWFTFHIYLIKKQTWSWHVMLRKIQLLDPTRVSDYHHFKPELECHESITHSLEARTCSRIFPHDLLSNLHRRRHGNIPRSRGAWHHRFRDKSTLKSGFKKMRQISWRWGYGWHVVLPWGAKKPDFPKRNIKRRRSLLLRLRFGQSIFLILVMLVLVGFHEIWNWCWRQRWRMLNHQSIQRHRLNVFHRVAQREKSSSPTGSHIRSRRHSD